VSFHEESVIPSKARNFSVNQLKIPLFSRNDSTYLDRLSGFLAHAAIGQQVLCGEPACIFGAEKRHHIGDVFRFAKPAKR
jgi:hypothetical protein